VVRRLQGRAQGNGRYCYPLTVSDHASRYLLLCEACESTREAPVIAAFQQPFRDRGLPLAIRSDNGHFAQTGYKIFNRYKEEGVDALCDRSRRPVRYANELPGQVERLIVDLKRDKPHWGARKIREGAPGERAADRQRLVVLPRRIPLLDVEVEAGEPVVLRHRATTSVIAGTFFLREILDFGVMQNTDRDADQSTLSDSQREGGALLVAKQGDEHEQGEQRLGRIRK
jgi:hypothetical protein